MNIVTRHNRKIFVRENVTGLCTAVEVWTGLGMEIEPLQRFGDASYRLVTDMAPAAALADRFGGQWAEAESYWDGLEYRGLDPLGSASPKNREKRRLADESVLACK